MPTLAFTFRFLMKRRQYVVTLCRRAQLENFVTSMNGFLWMDLESGILDRMVLFYFFSGSSSSLTTNSKDSLCHSSAGFLKKAGPFSQRSFISSTNIPRLKSSAGFKLEGAYLHCEAFERDCISATRTPTKGFSVDESERIQ